MLAASADRPFSDPAFVYEPKLDGYRVLRALRGDGSEVPILVLTARGEEANKVQAFTLGADDYVTKPFGTLELIARVHALLRRAKRGEGPPLPAVEPLPPRPRFRREPPADTVRRLYAEALWALQSREIVREPWQTPAEFAPVVASAVPSCADAFAELTRAYEDVRYGSLRIDETTVGRLEDGQQLIMAAI